MVIAGILLACALLVLPRLIRPWLSKKKLAHDAYHEAGHVVMSIALGYGFEQVVVGEQGDSGRGYVSPHEHSFDRSVQKDNEDIIKIALAGVIASGIRYAGNHEDEGYSDNAVIADVLERNPLIASGDKHQYLRSMRSEVRNILLQNKDAMDAISSLLVKHKTLNEEEVSDLLTSKSISISPLTYPS